ncbi:hypothetical protein HK096_010673, partial [Nowakowskiella sp. JEL0078]
MDPPAKVHFSLKPDNGARADEDLRNFLLEVGLFMMTMILENEIHPELQRLPALSLRGTFSKAYSLL